MPLTETDIREACYRACKANMRDPEFRMNPWTWCEIQRMKDDNGRFLWDCAMLAGEPERLLGFRVAIDRDISDGEVRLEDRWNTIKISAEN